MENGIEYEVVPNALTGDTGDYSFKVVGQVIHTEAEVIDAIVALCPSVKREQVVEVFDAFNRTMIGYVGKGEGAQTRFMRIFQSLQGKAGPNDLFNHLLHKALVHMLAGKEIAEAGKNPPAHKVPANTGMKIVSVTDLTTKSNNDKITRGGYIRVTGDMIELAGPDAAVFFMLSGLAPMQADISKVLVNKPSELLILVPATLPINTWCNLMIITNYSTGGGRLLKTPHKTMFPMPLTLVDAPSADDGEPVI
jgi:hypothetical protein